ncbi:hypothetical protein FACS1894187_07390 [Synergistales bacterium]|nr:hypothetical protein FACS1894187_07390 [Synergistales bacterium]
MRKTISAALLLRDIAAWTVISAGCLVALGTFIGLYVSSVNSGEEIFLPGVLLLFAAAAMILIFGVTRVIKYVKLFRQTRE